MCSIVVTYNESNPYNLREMAERVRHRGPDSMEVWPSGRHGVAACRLSIFGSPSAPMIYLDPESGRVVLLNGEIYNFTELRQDLSKSGCHFHTDLESEVIAKLYGIHGLDFPKFLKGMFAVAILDRHRLVLARDSFGIKPLYYTVKGDKVLVCSEIKGLLAHPDVTPAINLRSLRQTSVFGYVVDQGATFFEGIHQVKPGTVITASDGGVIQERRYSEMPGATYINESGDNDYDFRREEVRERLIKAVERMFCHGGTDKGIYLSGGLDSSTVALIARNILNYRVKTFTLADAEENPDFQAARKVANALGTEHFEFTVTSDDYWHALPDYIAHFESLMAGGVFHVQGGVAFHILSQKVAREVKVAFSGEGADELFGGYYWIYTHPLGFSDRIRGNLHRILPDEEVTDIVEGLFPQPEDENVYRLNLFNHLVRGGLSNYHLQSVDRSGGAFGFEIRPIYLYDELSQYAMKLPIEYKVPNKTTTKRVLRDAFRKDFEKAGIEWVNDRLKMGMPSAISMIDNEISEAVDKEISDAELDRHPLGRVLGSKLNLLSYDLFDHIFFKGWDHREENPPEGSLVSRLWPR